MNTLEKINKAIQDILDTCPNWNKKAYMLEPYKYGMKRILIMYDSFDHQNKSVYEDVKGIYIQGRSTSGEGKMYFHEFDGFELSKEDQKKREATVKELQKLKDTRIPSKEIKPGHICREYDLCGYSEYYVYLGKAVYESGKKINYYVEIHIFSDVSANFDNLTLELMKKLKSGIRYFDTHKGKLRFDKVYGKTDDTILEAIRDLAIERSKEQHYYGQKIDKIDKFID